MNRPSDFGERSERRVIVEFPVAPGAAIHRRRLAHRSTVRFVRPRQLALNFPPEPSLDQRIAAAKATSANYAEMAERDTNQRMRERHLKRADYWQEIAVKLINERNERNAQPELLQP